MGPPMTIVDTHCHIGLHKYEPLESLLFQMERCAVQRAVFIQYMGNPDNGYIVAGHSASTDIADCVNQGSNDFYLLRIDQNGNVLRNTMHGGSTSDVGRSVALTAESGYLIAGYSESTDIPGTTNSGMYDVFFTRVDENGGL